MSTTTHRASPPSSFFFTGTTIQPDRQTDRQCSGSLCWPEAHPPYPIVIRLDNATWWPWCDEVRRHFLSSFGGCVKIINIWWPWTVVCGHDPRQHANRRAILFLRLVDWFWRTEQVNWPGSATDRRTSKNIVTSTTYVTSIGGGSDDGDDMRRCWRSE